MSVVFLTGFPGFLGARLLPRILERDPDTRALCLIQPKFAGLSRAKRDEIVAAHPRLSGRIELVEGDIARQGLGVGLGADRMRQVREVYHLAAIYDLAVSQDAARKVNVEGTRNVLDFAEDCPSLDRFQYVSTCYVSGRYAGVFGEEDLDKGQSFQNHYEETKFLAEVDVQDRMAGGMPASVYRPAIVVGDSRTGETQKYDGPYVIIRFLLRQPRVAVLPKIGDPSKYRVNVVPSDFVLDALAHLSGLEGSRDRVYQLADPNPLTVDEMIDLVAEVTDRKVIRLPTPAKLAKGAIAYLPFVERWLQIPAESVDYFTHPTHYTSTHTQEDLAGSGIACPPFATYVRNLVRFVRENPDVSRKGLA